MSIIEPPAYVPAYLAAWRSLSAGADFSTPEGRFRFDEKLRVFLAGIEPRGLRDHYFDFFRRIRAHAYRHVDADLLRMLDRDDDALPESLL